MASDRRVFLQQIAVSTTCLLCSSSLSTILSACYSNDNGPTGPTIAVDNGDPVIDLSKETALQSVGGAVKKRYAKVNNGSTIIVVRTSDTAFIALSATCTHQGTEVNLPSNGVIICPGHGSRFNPNSGAVVQGPAASPLPTFSAAYDAAKNTVTIS